MCLHAHKIDTCMVQHYISRHGHVIEYSYVYCLCHTCQLYTHLYLYTYETVLCMLYHDYTIYLDYLNSGTCCIMGLQRCVAGRIYRIRLLPHSRYTNSGIIMLTITSSLVENITSSSMFTIHIQVNTLIHSMQHKVINNSCYYCLAKSSLLT